jgi:transcription initiation factor TFIID subunit 7
MLIPLETTGRRCMVRIKSNKYAATLVDLPCIIEGMKSWDKKGWMKSVDICQMLLVLGRCNGEEEARSFPLPPDVDPKTFQYAHGITAPMKWVRKRRFARTKRARVDEIEAVERRVHAMLEADKAALKYSYSFVTNDELSGSESGSENDATGEPDDYFDDRNGDDVDAGIGVDDFADMLAEAQELGEAENAQATLHPPEEPFAITSTSVTPSAEPTPISAPEPEQSSDEDEDDEGGDEDEDDADKEGDETLRQQLEQIEDMNNKIAQQKDMMRQTGNAILRRKLAKKIEELEDDVAIMKKNAGLVGGDDDE